MLSKPEICCNDWIRAWGTCKVLFF